MAKFPGARFLSGGSPDLGVLVLRLGLGLGMLLGHGWGKLISYADKMDHFPDPFGVGSPVSLGLAVFAEFFCSIALVLGIATRYAVIPLIVTMAVAAFVIHGADPFAKQEKALLYLVGYLAIFAIGPGSYSVDRAKG